MSFSLNEIHNEVVILLKEVNERLTKAFTSEVAIEWKDEQYLTTSVVTQIDRDTDSFLRTQLAKKFPDCGFINEEIGELPSKNGFTWIIDPVDGTANFAHKIPIFGVSIALWKADEPVYGIIGLPMQQQIVHAIRDHGAFLNNKKLPPVQPIPVQQSYTTFNLVGNNEKQLQVLHAISDIIPFPVNFHSASFQFAILAQGGIGCNYVVDLSLWDIAAGILIAKEVGLHVAFISPKPSIVQGNYRGYKHSLVVADKEIALQVAEKIRSVNL